MQKAEQADFAPFDATDWKIGIVVAEFNHDITEKLYTSAVSRAAVYKLKPENITAKRVAGAIEIPLVLQAMARTQSYQALLAIGCVIKGETPHFDYVCKFVAEGILRLQLDHKQPIGFGVLTCNNEAEAKARAGLGGDHLDAVMHQARTLRDLEKA